MTEPADLAVEFVPAFPGREHGRYLLPRAPHRPPCPLGCEADRDTATGHARACPVVDVPPDRPPR